MRRKCNGAIVRQSAGIGAANGGGAPDARFEDILNRATFRKDPLPSLEGPPLLTAAFGRRPVNVLDGEGPRPLLFEPGLPSRMPSFEKNATDEPRFTRQIRPRRRKMPRMREATSSVFSHRPQCRILPNSWRHRARKPMPTLRRLAAHRLRGRMDRRRRRANPQGGGRSRMAPSRHRARVAFAGPIPRSAGDRAPSRRAQDDGQARWRPTPRLALLPEVVGDLAHPGALLDAEGATSVAMPAADAVGSVDVELAVVIGGKLVAQESQVVILVDEADRKPLRTRLAVVAVHARPLDRRRSPRRERNNRAPPARRRDKRAPAQVVHAAHSGQNRRRRRFVERVLDALRIVSAPQTAIDAPRAAGRPRTPSSPRSPRRGARTRGTDSCARTPRLCRNRTRSCNRTWG